MTPPSTVPRAPESETRAGEELRLVEALDHLLDPIEALSPPSGGRSRTNSQPPPEFEVCWISYWRGYVKSRFQAITQHEGEMVAIFSSPFFRAGSPTPTQDDGHAVAVHAALTDEVSSYGWEITGCAANWYETTFRRRIAHAHVLRNV